MTIFPTALEARNRVINDLTTHNETVAIETAVMTAIFNNELEAYVDDSIMTSDNATGQLYFNVWQRTVTDRAADERMKNIISYFSNMGYSLVRIVNTSTGNTFKWYIVF